MVRIRFPPAASQERTPPSRSLAHFTDGQVSGRIGTTVRGRGLWQQAPGSVAEEPLGVYGGMNENFVLVAGRSRWQADGV
jgi:hypothetical protein